jgi:hypothetical protein
MVQAKAKKIFLSRFIGLTEIIDGCTNHLVRFDPFHQKKKFYSSLSYKKIRILALGKPSNPSQAFVCKPRSLPHN